MQIEFQFFKEFISLDEYVFISFFLFDYWKEKEILLAFAMIKQPNHRSKRRKQRSQSSRVVHISIRSKSSSSRSVGLSDVCLTVFQIMNIQGTVINKFSWIQILDNTNT